MLLVVAVAIVVFGYITFRSSPSPSTSATVTSVSGSASPSPQVDLVAQGKQLFDQYRCTVCHSTTGATAAGPSLVGLAGSQVKLNSGVVVIANTQYLKQSILDPDSQIVNGYGPSVMSAATDPFMDQIKQGNTVDALVAYIESLK